MWLVFFLSVCCFWCDETLACDSLKIRLPYLKLRIWHFLLHIVGNLLMLCVHATKWQSSFRADWNPVLSVLPSLFDFVLITGWQLQLKVHPVVLRTMTAGANLPLCDLQLWRRQSTGDVSRKLSSRMPLLRPTAKPAVTFSAFERCCLSADTNLYCLVNRECVKNLNTVTGYHDNIWALNWLAVNH